jgi:hypothetical protein
MRYLFENAAQKMRGGKYSVDPLIPERGVHAVSPEFVAAGSQFSKAHLVGGLTPRLNPGAVDP